MSKVLLGDVAVEHKETCKGSKDGYPIVGLEHLIPEEITLTAWDEGSENTFSKMFRKGNVLFGRRRAYLKKAAVAPFDGICSGDITVIEAKPDRILPELLPFIIQNDDLFDFAVGKSAGSLSPRVKWEHLKNYEFELPDMEKQKELAELLWAMDNTKKSYQKLIVATDELVKSQFMEQFGDATTNPKGLPTALIRDVAECYAGATPSTKVAAYWDDATIPWMSSGEVHNGRVSATEKKISQAGYDSCSTKMVPANSVVIALAGQGKTRGTVAITEIELCTNQSLCCIIPNSSVMSDYLYYHLKLRYEEMRNLAGIAEGRGGLNLKLIQGIRILVPSKADQEEFIALAQQSDKSQFFGEFEEKRQSFNTCSLIAACKNDDDIKCGPFGTQLKQSEYMEEGIPVWGIPQVNAAFSIPADTYVDAEKALQLSPFLIQSDDIAMSRKGNIGQCALYPADYAPGIIASDVLRIRPDKTKLLPSFLMCQFHYSSNVVNQIEMVGNGQIMKGINVTKLKNITIYIPPMELQEQFAAFVQQSDKSKLLISRLEEFTLMDYRGHGKM